MQQLFLHIQVTGNEFNFDNDILAQARKWVPEAVFFDIDNYSDGTTIATGLQALQKAEKVFILIEAEPEPDLGGALKVISKALRLNAEVAIFYLGQHQVLNKLMIPLQRKIVGREKSNLRAVAERFFTA